MKGRFIFYPDNSNRNVLSGHYAISGSVDSKTKAMKLRGTQWIVNPGHGYVKVGFSGLVRPDLQTILGDVIGYKPEVKIGKFAIKRITGLQLR